MRVAITVEAEWHETYLDELPRIGEIMLLTNDRFEEPPGVTVASIQAAELDNPAEYVQASRALREHIQTEQEKDYYVQTNVGKCRYVVNFHDGVKTHADGSKFYDIRIANNQRDRDAIIAELRSSGYRPRI